MDITGLPKYPLHDEPAPSQRERLIQADMEDRWQQIAFVVVPLCLILMFLTIRLGIYAAGVGLGALAGD
jgi:hypothetical protein